VEWKESPLSYVLRITVLEIVAKPKEMSRKGQRTRGKGRGEEAETKEGTEVG